MRVLVTGGAGYIGSNMCLELARAGHTPVILDNFSTGFRKLTNDFETVEGNIRDHAQVSGALRGCEAVIHFAASSQVGESVRDPRKYFTNNVEGTLALLDAVLETPVRKFVFSSTAAVYGEPSTDLIPETLPKQPLNPYGATKLFMEYSLAAYRRSHGLRSASLRYFNAAGADFEARAGELHSPETHLIPLTMDAVAGSGPPLTVFGNDFPTPDGTCIRDYIHVTDLAAGHLAALDYLDREPEGHLAFNLGTGRGYSVLEIIQAVGRVAGTEVPHKVGARREGDPARLVADPSLAQKHLGWKARYGLEEIVQTAWKWHRQNRKQAFAV
jgi:UDP-glucose-4-epimerase GalE